MPTCADYGGWVISIIAGRFEVIADIRLIWVLPEEQANRPAAEVLELRATFKRFLRKSETVPVVTPLIGAAKLADFSNLAFVYVPTSHFASGIQPVFYCLMTNRSPEAPRGEEGRLQWVAIKIADGEFLDYLNVCAQLRTQRVKVELLVELSLP